MVIVERLEPDEISKWLNRGGNALGQSCNHPSGITIQRKSFSTVRRIVFDNEWHASDWTGLATSRSPVPSGFASSCDELPNLLISPPRSISPSEFEKMDVNGDQISHESCNNANRKLMSANNIPNDKKRSFSAEKGTVSCSTQKKLLLTKNITPKTMKNPPEKLRNISPPSSSQMVRKIARHALEFGSSNVSTPPFETHCNLVNNDKLFSCLLFIVHPKVSC